MYFDNIGASKECQEFDLVINYSSTDFLTVLLQDYYWPSMDRQGGISNMIF